MITEAEIEWLKRARLTDCPEAADSALLTPAQFFDWQVETLVGKELAIYAHADPFRHRVLELGPGLFQLTPPPRRESDFRWAMSKVKLGGATGVSFIRLLHHQDLVQLATPSVLTDVDDGHVRRNVSPATSRVNIAHENRHAASTWCGIVYLALFPWALTGRVIDLVGSKYGTGSCPGLNLHDERPTLAGVK